MHLYDIELAKRIRKKERLFKRIRIYRKIDTFIKTRVYVISFFLIAIIIFLFYYINKMDRMTHDQSNGIEFANKLINRLSDDNLFKDNQKLVSMVDSMQVLIFVYNRQYQRDQEEIVYLQDLLGKQMNKSEYQYYSKTYTNEYSKRDTVEKDTLYNKDTVIGDVMDDYSDTIIKN